VPNNKQPRWDGGVYVQLVLRGWVGGDGRPWPDQTGGGSLRPGLRGIDAPASGLHVWWERFVRIGLNKKLSYCWETVRRESMPRIAEMDVEMTT